MTEPIYPVPRDVAYRGEELHLGLRVEAQDALRGRETTSKECIWFSPACLPIMAKQTALFG